MKRAVLWDSSAVLVLLDADGPDHARAAKIASDLAGEWRLRFITNYVEVETHALLLRKLGRALARFRRGAVVFWPHDRKRTVQLVCAR